MAPRFAAGLGVVLLIAALLPNAPAAEPETEIQRQLRAYYGDLELRPPWRKAVDQLSAEDTKARGEAARYLVALLTQALADERAATPAEEFIPRRRRYSQHPAYYIHRGIAEEVAKRPGSPAALPVFRWYLDNAPDRVRVTSVGGTDVYAVRMTVDLTPPKCLPLVRFASE